MGAMVAGADGRERARCHTLSGGGSFAAETPEGPSGGERLLAGMSEGYFEALVPSVLEVDGAGVETLHEGMRLWELSRRLWPAQDADTKTKCRTLRWLADVGKHDFLLRPSRSGYLVRADFVRALVEPERVLFIGPWTATFDEFIPEFLSMLRAGIGCEDFDAWVVQCVICASVTMHTMRLKVMRLVIDSVLGASNLDGSESAISRLYPLKVAVTKFIDRVRPLERCLRGLLMSSDAHAAPPTPHAARRGSARAAGAVPFGAIDTGGDEDRDEKDLGLRVSHLRSPMYRQVSPHGVSFISDGPSAASSNRRTLDVGLEEFLETWTTNTQEVLESALQLSSNITEAMKYCEASLTLLRTWLLKSELAAVVLSLTLTWGASVSGVFGMNLMTGMRNSPHWFWRVTAFIVISSVAIIAVSYGLFRQRKETYSHRRAQFGDNVFFQRLHEDEYVLSFKALGADGALSKAALDRVLKDLRTPTDAVKHGRLDQSRSRRQGVLTRSRSGVVKISMPPSSDYSAGMSQGSSHGDEMEMAATTPGPSQQRRDAEAAGIRVLGLEFRSEDASPASGAEAADARRTPLMPRWRTGRATP